VKREAVNREKNCESVKCEAVKSERRNRAEEQQSSRNFEFFNLPFEIFIYAIYYMLNALFFFPYVICYIPYAHSANTAYPIPHTHMLYALYSMLYAIPN